MAFSISTILADSTRSPPLETVSPTHMAPRSRQRRSRTIFSDAALDRLESVFSENPYPDINQREQLAEEAGVTEARIQVWFQNRRSRSRRSKTRPTSTARRDSGFVSSSPSPQKVSPPKKQQVPVPPPTTRSPYGYGHPFSYPYLFGCSPMMSPPGMFPMMPGYPDVNMVPSSPLFSPGASPTFHRFFEFPLSPIHRMAQRMPMTSSPVVKESLKLPTIPSSTSDQKVNTLTAIPDQSEKSSPGSSPIVCKKEVSGEDKSADSEVSSEDVSSSLTEA